MGFPFIGGGDFSEWRDVSGSSHGSYDSQGLR